MILLSPDGDHEEKDWCVKCVIEVCVQVPRPHTEIYRLVLDCRVVPFLTHSIQSVLESVSLYLSPISSPSFLLFDDGDKQVGLFCIISLKKMFNSSETLRS